MDYTPFLITFKLAFATTAILFLLAIPISYFITFSKLKGKVFLESLILLPIVLPPTVLGYYFLIFLGPNSSIGTFIENQIGISLAFTFPGILLGSIIFCTPFMLIPIINGFRNIPKNMIESTRLLKKSRINALWHVFLPNMKKSILNGLLLTFAHSIGEFGLILMIGGQMEETRVASVAIYDEFKSLNFDDVHYYSIILLCISFTFIFCLTLLTRKSNRSGLA